MATRYQLEKRLVGSDGLSGQCGNWLALVGYAVGSPDPAAPLEPLSDALTKGLQAVGVTPADPLEPSDADFAPLEPADLYSALDFAVLALLELAAEIQAARPTTDSYADRQKKGDARALQEALAARYAEANASPPASGQAPDDPCWRVPGDSGWGDRRGRPYHRLP